MAEKRDLDLDVFGEIKTRAADMEGEFSQRNDDYDDYENMFLMNWVDDKPNEAGFKTTISPDASNAILGAMRLLLVTDPSFTLVDKIEKQAEFEKSCGKMWKASGKMSRIPVHYDSILSALLYAEMVIAVNRTDEMVEYAKKANMNVKRAEKLAASTPFFFESWNPKEGYPEFDSLGLSAYYRKTSIRLHDAKTRFGDFVLTLYDKKSWREHVDLSIFYDHQYYCVWIDENLIILEEHGLPRIPISVTLTEGSMLFDLPEEQRRPFLYNLNKSKLWERKNLALSVFYTNLFRIGINPIAVHTYPPGLDSKLNIDANTGIVHMEQGETLDFILNKGVLDPSFQQAVVMADDMTQQSTLYRQVLGESLSNTDTFSTVAMLSQAGRLPLNAPQRRGANGIADATEIAMDWYKQVGKKHDAMDIEPKDVPDVYDLDVALEVTLPQDQLQNANTAGLLKNGEFASTRWIQEKILNITDPNEMQKEIWTEQASKAMFAMQMQQMMAMQEQQMQQMMAMQQQAQQGGMPPPEQGLGMQPPTVPGMEQGGMPPQGMPPEGIQQGMQSGAQFPQGAPPMQGIPNEMGGMMPGQGMERVPEGEEML